MLKHTLPFSSLAVSGLCLGTGNLGGPIDQDTSFRLLDTFLDYGGNFIDSAHVYSDWIPGEKHRSEKTLGAWMQSRRSRLELIIATKGAHPDLETMPIQRLSAQEITADLDGSLACLHTDTIDLYYLHRDDPNRPVGEIIETLNAQVRAGKIRAFGCSNWSLARIQTAQAYAAAHGLQGFNANQMLWSLAAVNWEGVQDKTLVGMDASLWAYHQASRLVAVPYSSQANGYFQHLAQGTTHKISAMHQSIYGSPEGHRGPGENRSRFERLTQLSGETGLTITQLVLGYLLAQPFTTLPIIGPQSVGQLEDSLSAANVHLTPEQVAFLVPEQNRV